MTSKLEEVARAICWADGENPDEVYGQHSTAEGRPFWVERINVARAALLAMKGPSKIMLGAGENIVLHQHLQLGISIPVEELAPELNADNDMGYCGAGQIFNAMIDAALEER